jgi:hypothetical protein
MHLATAHLASDWFRILPKPIQRLIQESFTLYEDAQSRIATPVYDYGYIVFPAAKAYEGFLKHYFYRNRLISKHALEDEHLRIGKAINPDLPYKFRDEDWLYEDLCRVCGVSTGRLLWRAWKQSRNKVFHYQVAKVDHLTLTQAAERVLLIVEAIKAAYQCEQNIYDDEVGEDRR